jgi:hypothetical protein
MNGPVASIIVSLILTLGFLFGTGSFKSTPPTYATVNFDGGYQKIGVISREEIFTEARVEINGERIVNGDFATVIAWIQRSARESDGVDKATWKEGVRLVASAGIRWTGSESNFKLATENLDIKSTSQTPIRVSEAIEKLNAVERQAKAERLESSKQALVFSSAPTESFLISKILAAIQK